VLPDRSLRGADLRIFCLSPAHLLYASFIFHLFACSTVHLISAEGGGRVWLIVVFLYFSTINAAKNSGFFTIFLVIDSWK